MYSHVITCDHFCVVLSKLSVSMSAVFFFFHSVAIETRLKPEGTDSVNVRTVGDLTWS